MKKYLILLPLLALFSFYAINRENQKTLPQEASVPVHTIMAKALPIPFVYNTIGTVVPLQEVTVRPQISGKLVNILFKEGDLVPEGTVIARIDDASAEAELDRTEAELAVNQAKLDEAENNLKRYRQLRKSSIISQKALEEQQFLCEQLRAAVKSDKAQVEIAQINYNHTQITAPISGRIGLKNINKGNLVSVSDTGGIATIIQLSPISVVFSLPQQLLYILENSEQSKVEAVDSSSGQKLGTGRITAVDNAVNPQNGTIRIRAEFVNDGNKLWPGQSVTVNLFYGQNKDNVVLPARAIRPGLGENYAFRVTDSKAEIVPIRSGYHNDKSVVVLSGVSIGDMIITDNFSKLKNGTPVEILLREERQ